MPQLVIVHDPFNRSKRDVHNLSEQSTVAALVGEYIPAGVSGTVSINGRKLAEEEWPTFVPAPDHQVVFVPRVQGGGDNLLGSVLMIGLAVASGPIGATLAGQGMLELGVSTLGLGLQTATWGMIIGAGVGAHGPLALSKSTAQQEAPK